MIIFSSIDQLAFLRTILAPAVLCEALSDEKLLWEDRSSKWLLCGALSEEAYDLLLVC
jgi:hypothetical protein